MRQDRLWFMIGAVALVSACGQAQDAVTSSGPKPDQKPYVEADNSYSAKNFSSGDAASWQKAVKERAQSQNDYVRSSPL
ncbi:MAG: hypothetical protein ACO3AX_03950 [Burkholderiaceae bacterium]